MQSYDDQIRRAIREKRLLHFLYGGATRIVEPQAYGIHRGEHQLLAYQVRGLSRSGSLPNWRRFVLAKMSDLDVLPEPFAGRRDFGGDEPPDFDEILAVAE